MATTPRFFRAHVAIRSMRLEVGDAVRYNPLEPNPITILRRLGPEHGHTLLEAFAASKLEEMPPNTPSPDAVAPCAPASGFGWGRGSSEAQ